MTLDLLTEKVTLHTKPEVYRTTTNIRPGWDTYFGYITEAVSLRGDCVRAKVGAVITKDNRIISTGYVGSHPGGPSCLAGECPRGASGADLEAFGHSDYSNCISLHGEQNAIAFASGRETRGATIYTMKPPCDMCTKLIRAAGIIRVVVVEVDY